MSPDRTSFSLFRITTPFSYILRQAKCIENLIKPASLWTWLYNRKEYLKNHVGFYSNTVLVDADSVQIEIPRRNGAIQLPLSHNWPSHVHSNDDQSPSIAIQSPCRRLSVIFPFLYFFFRLGMILSWYRNLYKINLWYEFSIGSQIYILFIKTRKNSLL